MHKLQKKEGFVTTVRVFTSGPSIASFSKQGRTDSKKASRFHRQCGTDLESGMIVMLNKNEEGAATGRTR